MQLQFVPVEEFYFALTLSVKTLAEFSDEILVATVRSSLNQEFGQPSTIAPGKQNTFNYVFRVQEYDNNPSPQLIVSISDWQDKLRLSSDYGWALDSERKPKKTDHFDRRDQFAEELRSHLQSWLNLKF